MQAIGKGWEFGEVNWPLVKFIFVLMSGMAPPSLVDHQGEEIVKVWGYGAAPPPKGSFLPLFNPTLRLSEGIKSQCNQPPRT